MHNTDYQNDLEKQFNEAVSLQQSGRVDAACKLYRHILTLLPDSPLVNYNLGTALFGQERFKEAYRCYKNALQSAPEEIDLLYNLALCSKKLGLYKETIHHYQKILTLDGQDKDTLYNLACCYKDTGMETKAISCYLKVLELEPGNEAALNNLAFLYHTNEDCSNAIQYYARLLQIHPDHLAAKHMLASLLGKRCDAVPLQYIKEIFDNYSARYENSLVSELEYKVPINLRLLFNDTYEVQNHSLLGLDLGCGTGLAGEAFAELCQTLTGVDISPKMTDIASTKKIYSSLQVAEIQDYLVSCSKYFTLILATDVLGYVGKLEEIFMGLNTIACPGAFFCFSIEKSENIDYLLRPSGRFAHSFKYIEKICAQTGWKLKNYSTTNLRREKDQWIDGILFLARKPLSA